MARLEITILTTTVSWVDLKGKGIQILYSDHFGLDPVRVMDLRMWAIVRMGIGRIFEPTMC